MSFPSLFIHADPLLPAVWLIVLGGLALLALGVSVWLKPRGAVLRGLSVIAFFALLMNPALLEEEREPLKDVALIIVDESPSQSFGDRAALTEKALAHLEDTLGEIESLDVRVQRSDTQGGVMDETRLFDLIDAGFTDVPEHRRAGVIVVSDGQVHDVPSGDFSAQASGPIHTLLSGKKNERDRQIIITQAPSYGITGQDIDISYIIKDHSITTASGSVQVRLSAPSAGDDEVFDVSIGEEHTLSLPITHPGQNVFRLSVEGADDELTMANNQAAAVVNGVRDRLKVLLVTGQPHTGGRTWRDLLKSDPGVDLVHFTILREPDKIDATPQNELSLIAFPFRELFEIKLYDFDLIIFDRYRQNFILPVSYFDNIRRYVREGGALLLSCGPDFAGGNSLATTSLGEIMPGLPKNKVISEVFTPRINKAGEAHPVTQFMTDMETPGPWLRQVDLNVRSGDVLMEGAQNKPLLILERVDKGRVAQLASDHIWLWDKGYKGGGPSQELLRRSVHWLMKEPQLDEQALTLRVIERSIVVQSYQFNESDTSVSVVAPDGSQSTLNLRANTEGIYEGTIDAAQLGVYEFQKPNGQKRFISVGDMNAPELRDVITTPDVLAPVNDQTGGGALWLSKTPEPSIRMMSSSGSYAGKNWIGLRSNDAYIVKGSRAIPLLSPFASLIFLCGILVFCWWREGRG